MRRKQERYEEAMMYVKKADALRKKEKEKGKFGEIENLHGQISDLYKKGANVLYDIGEKSKAKTYRLMAKPFTWPEAKKNRLVRILSFSSIGCLAVALIFVSLKMTGAVVGAEGSFSVLSFVFFVLGIVSALLYFRKKK